ncbi:hypothetical protein DFH28DRAFT_927077 [Melampsora americana]|nr:hypothetical protein DFH28DRAFT_927077 [Melampsora americana]
MDCGVWTGLRTPYHRPWTSKKPRIWPPCGSGLYLRMTVAKIVSLDPNTIELTLIANYPIRMAIAKGSSQSLQVPGRSSTRTLRPPSPSHPQPGFQITPNDSRTALTRQSTPGDGSPGPLSNRRPSPRPPAVKHKDTALPAVTKTKPNTQGKVSPSLNDLSCTR